MTEVEQPPQNGIDLSAAEEDDSNKARPADIEQDMREMERRKRVEAIMGSKLFREELERIVDAAREGGSTGGILQQLSDIVGMPMPRVGNVFKSSNCMLPINDIRGVESMGYAKGEKILRCKLAATFRLLDLYGWTQGLGAQITARLKVDQEYFLVNPYGLLYHEVTASSLNKVDMQGQIVEQGTTNFGVNKSHFVLHSAVHAARPDIRCAIYVGCSAVVAISSLKTGLLPLTKDACVLGEISTHHYSGSLLDLEERDKLVRNLGPNSKVMLLTNHGALVCGETIEEAFFAACHIVQACETQLKLLPVGVDNLVLIPEESRKTIYEQSRRPPEDLEKKFAAIATAEAGEEDGAKETAAAPIKAVGNAPKWRVGGAEFEALMRMLDNAGYRTGYIYRHPLVKSDPPKPKNDVELPPAVSSLGYLLEEEELYRQGIWKKGDIRKGGDRSRWLNSPNVYQKVEVLETGTPDPKKITKWVAEGSPTHSTPVRIEDPLQFVPAGTNPKEFKRLQQQIKDNRRADIISAGPQSHILEGVTWDEANRIKDATVSSAGDHVVLMGAASKGIIQRGYQHNAAVYKAPYAKNPFDNVTDDELNEYKRTVERKKKSIHGEYTDTDFSESEPLSSLQTSGAQQTKQNTTITTTAAVSQSEPEDVSEHQVMRIETQQAPVPSQPEVVLSDATRSFLNGERSNEVLNRKPPTGRDIEDLMYDQIYNQATLQIGIFQDSYKPGGTSISTAAYEAAQANKENRFRGHQNVQRDTELIAEMKNDMLFRRQKEKFKTNSPKTIGEERNENENDNNNSINDDGEGDGEGDMYVEVGNAAGSSFGSCSANYQTANETNNSHLSGQRSFSSPLKHLQATQGAAEQAEPAALSCCEHVCRRIMAPPRNAHCCTYYSEPYEATSFDSYASIAYGASMEGGYGAYGCHSEAESMYKKSIFCCTPAVCDRIFESLQRPLHSRAQSLDKDLIFNIPFSGVSPATSTRATTPRKTRADSPYKQPPNSPCRSRQHNNNSHSPYRTVSHFGFNSPQREPQPEHKHIPATYPSSWEREPDHDHDEPKKYVPVHKSVSYEEIFSSPRYVDLCENCFDKVLRLKPELMSVRTRLRNLMDLPPMSQPPSGGAVFACSAVNRHMAELRVSSEAKKQEEAMCYATGEFEYVECNSSDTTETLPPFSSQLEPLIEAAEEEDEAGVAAQPHHAAQQRHNGSVEQAISTSSFIEKIMRLNYSEESRNLTFLQTPCPVSSNISLEQIGEDAVEAQQEQVAPADAGLCNTLETLRIDERADECVASDSAQTQRNIEMHTSVTEIWEFGDWNTWNKTSATIAAPSSHSSEQISLQHDAQTAVCAMPARSNAQQDEHIGPSEPAAQRLLMSREERGRRKLEFQEIWEDHIAYFDGRDSDTESAIDGTTGKQQRSRSAADLQLLADEQSEPQAAVPQAVVPNELKEVFHGRSLIMKPTKLMPATTKATKAEQQVDEVAVASSGLCAPLQSPARKAPAVGKQDSAAERAAQQAQWLFHAPRETEPAFAAAVVRGMHSEVVEFDSAASGQVDKQYSDSVGECELYEGHGKKELVEQVATAEKVLQEEVTEQVVEEATTSQEALDAAALQAQSLANTESDFARELQFEDLLETADEDVDDDKLSEHFAELLLSVENLQIGECKAQSICTYASAAAEKHLIRVAAAHSEETYGASCSDQATEEQQHKALSRCAAATAVGGRTGELNAIELKILKKIELNQLREPANIFDKIESTIRNKLTPSRWQQMLSDYQQQENASTSTTTLDNFAASTPSKLPSPLPPPSGAPSEQSFQSLNLSNINEGLAAGSTLQMNSLAEGGHQSASLASSSSLALSAAADTHTFSCSANSAEPHKQNRLRRSRSLTTPRGSVTTAAGGQSPPTKLNKTTTPPKAPRKSPLSTRYMADMQQQSGSIQAAAAASSGPKRNFILENIRNAARPRNSNRKRLPPRNAQAIFSVYPSSAASPLPSCSSHSSLPSDSNESGYVYSFQSKLVRGSPRFWVSLTQASPARKHLPAGSQLKTPTKRRKHKQKRQQRCNTQLSDSTCTMDKLDACDWRPLQPSVSTMTFTLEDDEQTQDEAKATAPSSSCSVPNVDGQILALCEQIDQIQPRLDTYKRKLKDYGEHMAKCARNVDECIDVQAEIAAEQRELRQQVLLNQYMEHVACKAQTYSLSETED